MALSQLQVLNLQLTIAQAQLQLMQDQSAIQLVATQTRITQLEGQIATLTPVA